MFRAEGACAPLRNYAKTDSAEYFADCFAYWIANSGSTQAMARFQAAAPRTYTYFQALTADGWAFHPAVLRLYTGPDEPCMFRTFLKFHQNFCLLFWPHRPMTMRLFCKKQA